MAAERQIRWATVLEQRGWAGRDTYTLSSVGFFETLWTVAHQAPLHGILQARILERVAIPFSRGSSWPRDQTQVSYIAGRFFTIWATREVSGMLRVVCFKAMDFAHLPPMIFGSVQRHIWLSSLYQGWRWEFLFCLVLEARDAAKYPIMHRTVLTITIIQPNMSVVPRLRHSALK